MLRLLVMSDRRLASILSALLALAAAPAADATSLRVHPDSAAAFGPPYYATILAANAVAVAGDTIVVSNAGSPYVQTTTMGLVSGVVYRGGFGPAFEGPNTQTWETVIERQVITGDATAISTGAANGSTIFAGFTVTGGNASSSGGGIFCDAGAALTIRNCLITRNFAAATGGGIAVQGGAAPKIQNCDLERNVATLRGGGIAVAAGAGGTEIDFCRFLACSAATGGQTSGGGGGIFSASSILLSRCEIDSCRSGYRGGGLLTINADLHGGSNQFDADIAQSDGGAAYHLGGDGEHIVSSFERCTSVAGNGGGLAFEGGTWLVSQCFVRSCTALARGGGIYYLKPLGAELRLTEIVANAANRGGGLGVVGNDFRSVLSLHTESCTIALNSALAGVEEGGGIHVFGEGNFADEILNCIIADQVEGSCIATEGLLNQPNIRFNCVWNRDAVNKSPEYGLSCADRTGINGNIKIDPVFCNTADTPPQVSLRENSLCIGAGEGGVDLGAHPGSVGCAFVALESESWGRVKALFR